ncbi:MAG: hypothetical protein B7Y33_00160 [Hydrogenophilales bacterium 16-62-9]|nr:MAG: hypothetical protein B7Y33_00160 [Hydrogenophilales bacterium 16-62-9]
MGTTMCFTVSLQIALQAQARQRELVEQAGPLLKGIRVLVVEDNQVSREILAEMMHFFHLEVGTAANGPAALAALQAAVDSPYDLVLMDWRMPGMNGDEVTQRIHLDAAIPHKPKVVMVTAYGREDVIQLSEQAGVEGFLVKPVSPSSLLDTMLSVLGRGRILSVAGRERMKQPDLASSGHLAGAHVLLVEDNDINREFAVELLRSEGIEVEVAENGAQAVDQVQQQDFDAVLMDIQMPVMDGLEAARRIRALAAMENGERFARLPIIAMTALAMAQDAEQSRAAGMNDHVTKPIAPDRLMSALARVIDLSAGRIGRSPRRASADTTKTGEIPADLRALTSLDAAEGVRRIGGKADAYRKQLRRFREHYSDAVTQLLRLAAEQGMQKAEDYCHALKGVTGNIGAGALYGKVTAIDTRLKQGALPEAGDLDALRTLLEQVLRDIDRLDAGPAPAPVSAAAQLSPETMRDRLARLTYALTHDLGAAEPLLIELRKGVAGTSMEAPIDTIAALVDVFDIDTALAYLKALETSGQGNPI